MTVQTKDKDQRFDLPSSHQKLSSKYNLLSAFSSVENFFKVQFVEYISFCINNTAVRSAYQKKFCEVLF